VARQNFKDHYGPFADRASFALAASINPNFADVQHLKQIPGVGETTALDIIECRSGGPFTTAEELVARVRRVDIEEARKLSYFPFG
jgi:DNA uptake protein ComE-like DNA-binding protein